MFQYKVCDVSILSELSIPVFNVSDENCKNRIKITCKDYPLNQDFSQSDTLFRKGSIFYQRKPGLGFKISSKSNITIYNPKNINFKKVWEILIGLPLGYALTIMGYSVLHGSSISLKNNTACIIGFSGLGKSTLALSLLKRGCSFISEDLCVIKDKKIYNLYNWIKTSKDAISSLKIKVDSELKLDNDLRNRSFYKISGLKSLAKSKPNIFYFPVNDNKKSIEKMKTEEAFKFIFSNFYRNENNNALDINKISELSNNIDCYFFKRNIEDPLEENSHYLYKHFMSLTA